MGDIHLVFSLTVATADPREEVTNVEDLAITTDGTTVLPSVVFLAWGPLVKLIGDDDVVVGVVHCFIRHDCALEVDLHSLPLLVKLDVGNIVSVNS